MSPSLESESESASIDRPRLGLTMGDVAGVGPELIARAAAESDLADRFRIVIYGDPRVLERAAARFAPALRVLRARDAEHALALADRPAGSAPTAICVDPPPSDDDPAAVLPGTIDPRAGRAAVRFLLAAADDALANRIDAVVTLPLHKESIAAAGVDVPGHTELLARRCGLGDDEHAMMLYLPADPGAAPPRPRGLAVAHATLHVALRTVFDLLDLESVLAKIRLLDAAARPLVDDPPGRAPRLAVAGLNPHAGEGGLFGNEEIAFIAPAVARARNEFGLDVVGPIAADTLFARAVAGEFDGVLAMYHDQGHVAIKTIGFDDAVNVTIGLPIIRTSVAHGTAFDLAWTGRARGRSLVRAVETAARLVAARAADRIDRTHAR